ncbi:TetR/AcrR family transcriptional regulator [Martelella alba]|uniref:TetR/AcrR family transcriptional regulator n=1 Tax=Martelella alba TaxID=2590451 RepID=A0A506U9W6_9HYPH|nr:TetR/AcrR family transcriptional regulator [Martelella alba]TPW30146.1 TetR/AcrR family transcriptional regulator [Martelella alba]
MEKQTTRYETGSDRRREIALAARSLIAERGLEGLRTRAVADRVGINIATLHYHVSSKDGLVQLVTEQLRDEFTEAHLQTLKTDMTPLERLRCEFVSYRQLRQGRQEQLAALQELTRHAARDEKVAAFLQPMRIRWRARIEAILEAGREEGTFRADLDAPAFAAIIVSVLISMDSDIAATGGAINMTAIFAELVRSALAPSSGENIDELCFE